MRHAHSKYDDINTLNELIGKEEPVFLLRALDQSTPDIMEAFL